MNAEVLIPYSTGNSQTITTPSRAQQKAASERLIHDNAVFDTDTSPPMLDVDAFLASSAFSRDDIHAIEKHIHLSPVPSPQLREPDDEERALIERHTRSGNANYAGALRMRTHRDQHDIELHKPDAPKLPDIIGKLPERNDESPLLDQHIDGDPPPIDWSIVRAAVPFAMLGIAAGTTLLFVVLPTLIQIHNTGSFSFIENIGWRPILAALLGTGLFAWQEGENGKAALFSGDAILISTWY